MTLTRRERGTWQGTEDRAGLRGVRVHFRWLNLGHFACRHLGGPGKNQVTLEEKRVGSALASPTGHPLWAV